MNAFIERFLKPLGMGFLMVATACLIIAVAVGIGYLIINYYIAQVIVISIVVLCIMWVIGYYTLYPSEHKDYDEYDDYMW